MSDLFVSKELVARLINAQLMAVREAGAVKRCHILPHIGHYDVAQHCYGAVSLLLLLHKEPSHNLIQAVLWHDVAERWLGDLPATAKWDHRLLGRVYEVAETEILRGLGLNVELTAEEAAWLKTVDLLELWLWSREQRSMGNGATHKLEKTCEDALDGLKVSGTMPEICAVLYDYLRPRTHARLSDMFDEVVDGLKKVGA